MIKDEIAKGNKPFYVNSMAGSTVMGSYDNHNGDRNANSSRNADDSNNNDSNDDNNNECNTDNNIVLIILMILIILLGTGCDLCYHR